VLARSGYRPVMPGRAARPLCCGRTYLAAGMIESARKEARRLLAAMDDARPVIGLEPSCLLTLRDELPALLPGAAADRLASRAVLLSEFLEREQPPLPLKPLSAPSHSVAHIHGHCHQKSFGAFPAAIAALKRVPQLEVRPIAASCCGMAGAFGYQSETLDISRAMAEQALLPAVRTAGADDLIVADGTSCRHQIRDLAGRSAVHSVRVLAAALQ
jgi:Fe-S oxidoreductase